MNFDELVETFKSLQNNTAIWDEYDLQTRVDAIETLSFIDEVIEHNPNAAELVSLSPDIHQMQHRLESINLKVFDEVRRVMKSLQTTPATLRKLFDKYTSYQSNEHHYLHVDYEALDVLLAGVLFPIPGPEPELELQPEMVQWEASPGSVILDLLDHIPYQSKDVFFDIGSGLGNVAILVNRLSGIEVVGVERDPAYFQYATNLASAFSLESLSFVNADARDVDLSRGTIFYLFTPFVASVLREVMEKIRVVTQHHPVYVCSYGPCTPEIAELSWLHNINDSGLHEFMLAIFAAGNDS